MLEGTDFKIRGLLATPQGFKGLAKRSQRGWHAKKLRRFTGRVISRAPAPYGLEFKAWNYRTISRP
jgi:hypothetical protein